MKKFELIPTDIKKVYRIKSLIDFDDVKRGDLGGYVEKEGNLSHEGNCWIYDKSRVSQDGYVEGDSKVKNSSFITNNACASGSSVLNRGGMLGYSSIRDNAILKQQDISGFDSIAGNGVVTSYNDFLTFQDRYKTRWYTWTKSNNNWQTDDYVYQEHEFLTMTDSKYLVEEELEYRRMLVEFINGKYKQLE